MSKFTPKPWTRVVISATPRHVDEQLCHIGRAALSIQHDNSEEGNANAQLAMAAPDLYAVVQDYLLLCELHDWVGAVPDAARAALAKARGE